MMILFRLKYVLNKTCVWRRHNGLF